MGLGKIKKAAGILAAALLLETGLCNWSFWSTLTAQEQDVTGRMEMIGAVAQEEVAEAGAGIESAYEQDGYLRIPEGACWLRLKALNQDVRRLWLDLDIPHGYLIRASVYVQDEGNHYLYQLGEGRILLREAAENARMKLYPYGKVKNLYVRLETADSAGHAAPGALGDLVCNVRAISLNGRTPFAFRPVRFLIWLGLLTVLSLLSARNLACHETFDSPGQDLRGRRWRNAGIVLFTAALLGLAVFFVRLNPACQKNLALHHAQYQELARSLSQGRLDVGEGDARLFEVENPYDTIFLQAQQIPYQADYAWYNGRYYVYFGIVPELLLYLPWYLLTGQDLQNYQAVLIFMGGFILACAGLVYELMRRWFDRLWYGFFFLGLLMLTGSYSLFYLLIRPDLYDVPIAAAHMFTAAGLWGYLAGLRARRNRWMFYGFGSLCLALTAGCRPQFLLFAFLAVPLFWKEVFHERSLFSRRSVRESAALLLPFAVVGGALMYYNAVRFGSPFDFGAAYSMTSNDMTHRGFNLERVLYGFWYFLFQPWRVEGVFPWLQSAAIETDYLGRMVSESCFGGVFACSMLTWPLFTLWGQRKRLAGKGAFCFTATSAAVAVAICAVDATGAGILQRYSADISFGLFLASLLCLFSLAEWAIDKGVLRPFSAWLKVAVLLHLAFLFLVLLNTDGSVNLLRGDPALYFRIQAAMRW